MLDSRIDDQLALPEGFSDFSQGLSVFVSRARNRGRQCPSLLQLSNAPEHDDIDIGRLDGSITTK